MCVAVRALGFLPYPPRLTSKPKVPWSNESSWVFRASFAGGGGGRGGWGLECESVCDM